MTTPDVAAADAAAAAGLEEQEATKVPKQAEKLVRLAEEHYDVFRGSAEGNGNILAVPREGPNLAFPLKGERDGLRSRLAALYRREHGTTPSQNALAEAMTVLAGQALDGLTRPVYRRVAWHEGRVVLDLADDKGRAVLTGADGWRVLDRSPVTFLRVPNLTLPLPVPRRRGSFKRLRELVNIGDEDWPLVLAWLVLALMPGRAHPILRLQGELSSGWPSAGTQP